MFYLHSTVWGQSQLKVHLQTQEINTLQKLRWGWGIVS